jgi:hypothetical protein
MPNMMPTFQALVGNRLHSLSFNCNHNKNKGNNFTKWSALRSQSLAPQEQMHIQTMPIT